MADRAKEMKPAISAYVLEEGDDVFEKLIMREEEWESLDQVHSILAPLHEITTILEASSYATVSLCIPLMNKLMDFLERCVEREDDFSDACADGLEKLEKYYNKTSEEYTIATILDPRFNLTYYTAEAPSKGHVNEATVRRTISKAFPIVAKMARDYLAMPGTSADSERSFSLARQMITDFRHSLNPETVRACMCLRSWHALEDS